MKEIIKILFIMLLLTIPTTTIIFPEKTSASTPGEISVDIDTTYMYDFTKTLSYQVKDAYPDPEELHKGRAFGSKGELNTSSFIMNQMIDIGLLNVKKTMVEDLPGLNEYMKMVLPEKGKLNNSIDILSRSLVIYNTTNKNETVVDEFYISPIWKDTAKEIYDKTYEFPRNQLTDTFTENGLLLIDDADKVGMSAFDTYFYRFFENFTSEFINYTISMIENGTYNISGFWDDFFIDEFENHYAFSMDNINASDNSTWPSFLTNLAPIQEPFLFIEENQQYNPNASGDGIFNEMNLKLKILMKILVRNAFRKYILEWYPLKYVNVILHNLPVGELILQSALIRRVLINVFGQYWGELKTYMLHKIFGTCKGILRYEFQDSTYDMNYVPNRALPFIWVNGTIGDYLTKDIENLRINYTLDQEYNSSVESYIVSGEIIGENTDQIIILSCLYDSWWNQGTGDSAVGMSIVMALAKYLKSLDKKPKNTIRFVAFPGEEQHLRGAHYYAQTSSDDILMMIDLNQLGMDQSPEYEDVELTMHVQANNIFETWKLERIEDFVNFENRWSPVHPNPVLNVEWAPPRAQFTNADGPFHPFIDEPLPSNHYAFQEPYSDTIDNIVILKDYKWTMHHRDGEDHEDGDCMDYIDWDETNLTAELVWNITKYYCLDPDCEFLLTGFAELIDKSNNGWMDTVRAHLRINSDIPDDRISINGILINKNLHSLRYATEYNIVLDGSDSKDVELDFTLPFYAPRGKYFLKIYLRDSSQDVDQWLKIIKLKEFDFGINTDDSRRFPPLDELPRWYYLVPYREKISDPTNPNIKGNPTQLYAGTTYEMIASATDPNNYPAYYQWQYQVQGKDPIYSNLMGPYESGQNHTLPFMWALDENVSIRVRAKNSPTNPDYWSNWSEPLNIDFEKGCCIHNVPLKIVEGEEFSVNGTAYGYTPVNWTWYFDYGGQGEQTQKEYTQNASYNYTTSNTYTIRLNAQFNDTVIYNFTHDIEVVPLRADFTVNKTYSVPLANISLNDNSLGKYSITNHTWNISDGTLAYTQNITHNFSADGEYTINLTVTDSENNTDFKVFNITVDSNPPELVTLFTSPDLLNISSNVTFYADFFDNESGVQMVSVNISYPNGVTENYSMEASPHSPYGYEFSFSNTSQLGQYRYQIWAFDYAGNCNCTSGYEYFNLPHLFGYPWVGELNQTIDDRIAHSVFRPTVNCQTENITAYLYGANTTPPPTYQCMLYRTNDSQLLSTTYEQSVNETGWTIFSFNGSKPWLDDEQLYTLSIWGSSNATIYYDNDSAFFGDGAFWSNNTFNASPPVNINSSNNTESRVYSIYCSFTPEMNQPIIFNVSNYPDTVGFGYNITISADVTDNQSTNESGVQNVWVNITYPDNVTGNYTMNNTENNTYQYTFNNTWQIGQYTYTIWAMDKAYNSNSSTNHSFNVTTTASMTICTIKDNYIGNETINLTDPPVGSPYIGYKLLDNNTVLQLWNKHDNYYFNTSSGIQLTNHKDKYWSHNVLMLGYLKNNQWDIIYRTDELTGFTKEIDTDNTSYVNITFWKDLTYKGYPFRLALRYHLKLDDNELTVIPYIKNLGDTIPYILGFGWEINDIQIAMTPENDYIQLDNQVTYLNQTLNTTYTTLNDTALYLMEDITSMQTKSLYLKWNPALTYMLRVKSRQGQYNAPVSLFIRIGYLSSEQEKSTTMYWYDSDQYTYYYEDYDEEYQWENNPSYMTDGNISTYANAVEPEDIELCNDLYPNMSGGSEDINRVEIRAYVKTGEEQGQATILLKPLFRGENEGEDYLVELKEEPEWSEYLDITNDAHGPGEWTWTDVMDLDCQVISTEGEGFYCSKVEVRVTCNNSNPVISNPIPTNGAINISLSPQLGITISDPDGDQMDIAWKTNSSGSWQTFATNTNVNNGTYYKTFTNANENGKWWYWKVQVDDDITTTVSPVFKFFTGRQSKIKNNGNTSFKGYLLIQIQFYNQTEEKWVVVNDTINETTPRTISTESQFGLDTVFNGLINTDDFSEYGNGDYRIYTAFRDLYGNVLEAYGAVDYGGQFGSNSPGKLEATYEFTITFS